MITDDRSPARPKRFSRQYWLRLGMFFGVALMLGVSLAVYTVVYLFVHPLRIPITTTPAEYGLTYEEITLTTSDDLHLAGWYIPGTSPNAVILVHGVNANRSQVMLEAALLAEAGFHILVFDLRGHGQSDDSKLTYGYYEARDVQAAVDYLLALPEVERVGALGFSLGGAVVARAAAIEPRLQAVAIHGSYSSLSQAVEEQLGNTPFFLGRLIVLLAEHQVGVNVEQVDSARDLATFHKPVMIIHGSDYDMFSLDHAYTMYEAAPGPKELWVVEGLGHSSAARHNEAEFRARVISFFENAFSE